jgi:hypothetical protein
MSKSGQIVRILMDEHMSIMIKTRQWFVDEMGSVPFGTPFCLVPPILSS